MYPKEFRVVVFLNKVGSYVGPKVSPTWAFQGRFPVKNSDN